MQSTDGSRPPGAGHRVTVQPPDWPRPRGYTYGVVTQGPMVFLSGIIGRDAEGHIVAEDFLSQVRQALVNIIALLQHAGAAPADIVRMTWYVVDKKEYVAASKEIGAVYREIIGRHYPAMTAVAVAGRAGQ